MNRVTLRILQQHSSRSSQISFKILSTSASENNNYSTKLVPNQSSFLLLKSKCCQLNTYQNLSIFSTDRFFKAATPNFAQEWIKILKKAEKIVGYPTSFLNLRYLVSDEVAHFANLLRKMMLTKHPLIKMARRLFSTQDDESTRSTQINGLIVLLISKAAGVPKKLNRLETEISDGIHNSQRCLAEIAEMIHMGSVVHKGILDLKLVDKSQLKDMDQGNKLAVLCGDYLLANACTNLAKLHNTKVVELMSQVIADISQGIFDQENVKTHTLLKIWYDKVNSASSSLLANSAKSSMLLVDHSIQLQEVAWSFAKHLDIMHKIWSELMTFQKEGHLLDKPGTILNAIYKDKFYKAQTLPSETDQIVNSIETNKTQKPLFLNLNIIRSFTTKESPIQSRDESSVVNECRLLFNDHHSRAMEFLLQLENKDSEKEAVASLKSILNVMKNSI